MRQPRSINSARSCVTSVPGQGAGTGALLGHREDEPGCSWAAMAQPARTNSPEPKPPPREGNTPVALAGHTARVKGAGKGKILFFLLPISRDLQGTGWGRKEH